MSLSKCNIEEDNKDAKEACIHAKHGDFSAVYKILRIKPYLVNFIPEDRGWAILHHAVWWNYRSVVITLLSMPHCDFLVKTHHFSEDKDNKFSSLTPRELAEKLGDRHIIIDILRGFEKDVWKKRFEQKIKFFVSAQEGEDITKPILPLFADALISYKVTLVGATNCPKTHMMALLHQIFGLEDHNWTKVGEQIHDSLYGVDRGSAEMFKKSYTETQFFENIIRFFTGPNFNLINDLFFFFFFFLVEGAHSTSSD